MKRWNVVVMKNGFTVDTRGTDAQCRPRHMSFDSQSLPNRVKWKYEP